MLLQKEGEKGGVNLVDIIHLERMRFVMVEYMIEDFEGSCGIPISNVERKMNDYAEKGWRVISTVSNTDSIGIVHFIVTFERDR